MLKVNLPQYDGKALDAIKIVAAALMVIDHINAIHLKHDSLWMLLAGRGVFPLFCYAAVLALMRMKKGEWPQRYITRLLIAAVLVQPFHYFSLDELRGNILFTLAAGVAVAAVAHRLTFWQLGVLYTLAAVSMLWKVPIEFGFAGIMLPSALLLVLRGQKNTLPFLLLMLCTINLTGIVNSAADEKFSLAAWLGVSALFAAAAVLIPLMVLDFARYMAQTGRYLHRYALYIFYPAHMTIIKLLSLALAK